MQLKFTLSSVSARISTPLPFLQILELELEVMNHLLLDAIICAFHTTGSTSRIVHKV